MLAWLCMLAGVRHVSQVPFGWESNTLNHYPALILKQQEQGDMAYKEGSHRFKMKPISSQSQTPRAVLLDLLLMVCFERHAVVDWLCNISYQPVILLVNLCHMVVNAHFNTMKAVLYLMVVDSGDTQSQGTHQTNSGLASCCLSSRSLLDDPNPPHARRVGELW